MNKRSGLFVIMLAAFLSLVCVTGVKAQGSAKPEMDDTTKQLLEEVRALRLAMQTIQRMSMDHYRSQLLVERVRADRDEVRRLSESVSDTHEKIIRTQATIPQFQEQQKLLENRLQLEVDQGRRAELEFEIKRSKEAIENYKSQIDPLKEREQQLTSELNTAKARLDDLQSRLDSLERAIENDRQKLDADGAKTRTP